MKYAALATVLLAHLTDGLTVAGARDRFTRQDELDRAVSPAQFARRNGLEARRMFHAPNLPPGATA